MLSGFRATALMASAMLFGSYAAAPARDLTITPGNTLSIVLDGTLGPVLSGNDPAGLDGQSATVAVAAKEALNPYKTTARSASYHIAAGNVTVTVNGSNYTSTSRSTMIAKLGNKADLLTLKARVTIFGQPVSIVDISSLQSGSWTSDVLQHPAMFSPSPQDLTEPSSTFTYTVSGQTTVLGVTGTASNSE